MTAARHDRALCGGWIVSDDGRPLRKCPECVPPRPSPDKVAIRGLLLERSGKPGHWIAEEVLAGTLLAGSPSVGAVVRSMAAEGLILRVGSRHAVRRSRHAAAVAVWVGRDHAPGQAKLNLKARRDGR